jgi:hypothetical protein
MRKTLMKEVRKLESEAQSLKGIMQMSPAFRLRQEEADRLRAKAEDLKDQARLEDIRVWEMEKVKITKSGSRSYGYWMAT